MHDTQRIVWKTICQCTTMLFEIMLLALFDIVPFDFNIVVSVWSWLNMECSKGMKKLVLDCTMEDESESFDVLVCESVLKLHICVLTCQNHILFQDWLPAFPSRDRGHCCNQHKNSKLHLGDRSHKCGDHLCSNIPLIRKVTQLFWFENG